MSFEIDHLVICVPDLDHNPFPLSSVEGGRHAGHGTANRIIPLGDAYIELVAVVDIVEAAESPFGSWVLSRAGTDTVDALCLRTTEIETMSPTAMSRMKPDGSLLSWRIAGLDGALDGSSPFFIQWDDMDAHPARIDLNTETCLESVTFACTRDTLHALTGPVDRLIYLDGPSGIEFTTNKRSNP